MPIAVRHASGIRKPVLFSIAQQGAAMNWDRIEGNWKQLKGKAKQQWGKLTDDQLDVIAGNRDVLAGKIQESYGITKDEAEKQLDDFADRYGNSKSRQ
jgi:uncharacterized protein YjbJ (UPF0337 family)